MWVSVTLEAAAAHAEALSDALLAAGAISVSVEDAQAGQVIAAYAPYLPLTVGATHEGWVRLEGCKLGAC